MTVQDRARAAERRANLLADLNEAPSALIGWDAHRLAEAALAILDGADPWEVTG